MNETSNNILKLLKSNQEFINVTKNEENMEAMKKQEIWGASMGMSQICSLLIYSKQETCIHEWKLEDNNKSRDTIPFYQIMESNNNPLSSSKNIQETIQKHETSISSKAYMTIYCFYHQVQPCLQWKPLEYIGSSEENLMVQLAILLA